MKSRHRGIVAVGLSLLSLSTALVAPQHGAHNHQAAHRMLMSPRMQLTTGTKMDADALQRAKISGRRAAVFFVPDTTSAGSVEELASITASAENFEALCCDVLVAVQPGAAISGEGSLRVFADEPFELKGAKTTLRRAFGVPTVQTARGPETARLTYVIDIAGVVRGVFADEKAYTAHAAYALEALREMESAPETEDELEFQQRSVETADGQRVALRPSAVGRMRERQAREKAEREAARAAGKPPSWWPF